MIRAVLFDVGETLLTSEEAEEIHQKILAEKGIEKELDEIKEAVKIGAQKFYKKHGKAKVRKMKMDKFYLEFNHFTHQELGIKDKNLAKYANKRFFEVINLELFDDTKTVLNKLSAMGLQPGLVSNGFQDEIILVMKKVGLDRSMFSVIVGRDTAGAPKPDPRPFLHAAGSLGLKPEEILFVGDKFHHDYEGSQGVGMKPVLILRGRKPPAEAPDDITTIQTLDEIMTLIQ